MTGAAAEASWRPPRPEGRCRVGRRWDARGEASGCPGCGRGGRPDPRALRRLGAVLYAPQASVAAAVSVCSGAAGKGRGWRKGIACRKHSGSAKGEKGTGGKMPDRWRNAGGGRGAVLRILGVFIVQMLGVSLWKEPNRFQGKEGRHRVVSADIREGICN